MKLLSHIQSRRASVLGAATRAFTMMEMMTVVGIFSLLAAATVSSQLFGLRLYSISGTKLTVTGDARSALNRVRDEIRSGKLIYVGNGNSSSFALVPDNSPQVGNALKICATTDTNSYVYYYMDATNSRFKRMVSSNSFVQVVASHITNLLVFQAEDFQGNVVTNNENNRVIRISMEFYQPVFPTAAAAPTAQTSPPAQAASRGMYDYFRLQTRVSRRAIE
jgi:prepilin-type N-terminal cleavage/methylation domain-containing protein